MKLFDKNEVKELLGKAGLDYDLLLFVNSKKFRYINGIEVYDDVIKDKTETQKESFDIQIQARQKGLEIIYKAIIKKYVIALLYDQITKIVVIHQDNLATYKKKISYGKAMLGGLFLGPLGALFGGSIGTPKKKININMPDNIITFNYLEDKKEKQFYLGCADVAISKVIAFLSKYCKGKVELVSKDDKKKEKENTIGDIEKLSILKDKGIISQEEFEKKKKELLDRI